MIFDGVIMVKDMKRIYRKKLRKEEKNRLNKSPMGDFFVS